MFAVYPIVTIINSSIISVELELSLGSSISGQLLVHLRAFRGALKRADDLQTRRIPFINF